MGWIAAFSLLAAFLAFWFLFTAFGCVRRRRLFRAGGSALGCLLSAALAGATFMLFASYLSYSRLVGEQRVASLYFQEVSPGEYQARLMVERSGDQVFTLRGDEWQLDARIVSWKPPLTILGLEPIYQLDRLSGRYGDVDRERTEVRTVHSLSPAPPTDIFAIARRFPALLPGIDAHYGTATYVPMADGAHFEVSLSRDALIARPANDEARAAVGAWRRDGE